MISATALALRAGVRGAAASPRVASRAAAAVTAAAPSKTPTAKTESLEPSSRAFSSSARALAASSPTRDRTREIVALALGSIGSKREANQYLDLFTSVSSQKFAVIKVGGAILEPEYLDELCRSVCFLTELNLFPVIVHGAGPQLNRLLEDAGVEPEFEEGIRVTDAKTLGIARKLFLEENLRLITRLDELGVATRSISGVFEADYLDKEKWKYVGKVTNVKKEAIEKSIAAGYVPVLTSMAEGPDACFLNVNADVAAAELARSLKPLKVIYLSEKGGLFDGDGNKLSTINLDSDFDHLMSQGWMRYGNRLKLKEIKSLLDDLPRSSSVAISHPSDLQRELFTETGAGTLIRRGIRINKTTSLSQFESLDKLKAALVRNSTGLDAEATVERFVNSLEKKNFTAYYDDSMECLAVVTAEEKGISTLATLNVSKSGWLSNMTENVFGAIKKDHPALVWTISEDDENLTWFFEKADGSFNKNGRVLFYYGCDMHTEALLPVYEEFLAHGRDMLGDMKLESRLRQAAQGTSQPLKA